MTSTIPATTLPAPAAPAPLRPRVRRLPELDCDSPAVVVPRTPSDASPPTPAPSEAPPPAPAPSEPPPPAPAPGGAEPDATAEPTPQPAEARLHAHTVLRQILEVLDGRRPAIQLADTVTEPVLRYLTSAAGRLDEPRSGRARTGVRRTGLLRAGAAERTAGAGLRSVRVCHPVDGVAEVSVVWRYRGRFRALAARFELSRTGRPVPPPASESRLGLRRTTARPADPGSRWRCTVLRIG